MKAVLLPSLSKEAQGVLATGSLEEFKAQIMIKVVNADSLKQIASVCYAGFTAAINAIGGNPSKISQLIVDYKETEDTPERIKGTLV